MSSSLSWLALEVKDREAVTAFYRDHLDLPVSHETTTETVLHAGTTDLVLRRPSGLPRGGLHTHYAFSIPVGEYDDWVARLDPQFNLTEFDFGSYRSLYLDDPAGNCVELGQRDVEGPGITDIFEVVLEVASVGRAVDFYTSLGFEVVDDGGDRPRTRLSTGALDLELWEPQLGLADGRGGVHVDWGLHVEDPATVAARVESEARRIESVENGIRVWDRDGHALTLVG